MKIKLNDVSNLSIWSMALIMLCSMKPWFTWDNPIVVYVLLTLFILCRSILFTSKITKRNFSLIIGIIILYTLIDIPHANDLKRIIEYIFRHVICISFIILMKIEEKKKLLKSFIELYVGILFVSCVFYLLYLINLLPISLPISISDSYYSWGFTNHIFLITPNTGFIFSRFQSIFLEPGHVGMISALCLYPLKYKWSDKRVVILIISILLSFSLAAYVLFLLGFILFKLTSSRRIFIRLLQSIAIIFALFIASFVYYENNPNSLFSELILSRFEFDEERGFVGNNRTNEQFDYYYDNVFYKNSSCLLGIGSKVQKISSKGGNSSYKVFIVSNGIIGIILLGLFFFSFVIYSKSFFMFGFFILYVASFWQRPYALWEVELVIYISTALLLMNKNRYSLCDI